MILFGDVLAWHLTDHLQRSVHIGPEDFVFTQEFGGPLNPDVLRRDVLYSALYDFSGVLGVGLMRRASSTHVSLRIRHEILHCINPLEEHSSSEEFYIISTSLREDAKDNREKIGEFIDSK